MPTYYKGPAGRKEYWTHFELLLAFSTVSFRLCPRGVVNGAGIPQLQIILGQHMQAYGVLRNAYRATSQGRLLVHQPCDRGTDMLFFLKKKTQASRVS